jgi:hypothetical protein
MAGNIDDYLRSMEKEFDNWGSLANHPSILPEMRARMVDWMIEVLSNFKCDELTFFIAVSIMDRYFKLTKETKKVEDLHIIGVTSMFLASKFEDIIPLKMKAVYEKIVHRKIEQGAIRQLELDIMQTIQYKIHAPTVLDFLKDFMVEVLDIHIVNRTETEKKEEMALQINKLLQNYNKQTNLKSTSHPNGPSDQEMSPSFSPSEEDRTMVQKYLIEKTAIYVAKMS